MTIRKIKSNSSILQFRDSAIQRFSDSATNAKKMAKIITLPKRQLHSPSSKGHDGLRELIHWTNEMNNILILIEQSLENTPINAKKDINRRR